MLRVCGACLVQCVAVLVLFWGVVFLFAWSIDGLCGIFWQVFGMGWTHYRVYWQYACAGWVSGLVFVCLFGWLGVLLVVALPCGAVAFCGGAWVWVGCW